MANTQSTPDPVESQLLQIRPTNTSTVPSSEPNRISNRSARRRQEKTQIREKRFNEDRERNTSEEQLTEEQSRVPKRLHTHLDHDNVADPEKLDESVARIASTARYRAGHHLHIPMTSPITAAMTSSRLFVASLGNPPPYASTRHSAGHILLKALQSYLQLPSFQKSRIYANGLTSLGAEIGCSEYTLWQSPSLMNVSGVALLKAYKTHVSNVQLSPTDLIPGLVVIYDEMETTPNQLRLRRGATSAKGHNGLKSVQQSLQSAGLTDKLGNNFIKIGVGIGRPPGGSRTSEDVSQYVLGQLTGSEKQGIENKAGELAQLLEAEMMRMDR